MYILLISAAVDFENLMVFSPPDCQVTFFRIYKKFLVSIELPELNNLVCLPEMLALQLCNAETA